MLAVLKILLIVLEVVCAFLPIGVILLQKPRSQGAGMAFGAGVGESLFGAQTGNVLTRTTVVLGIIFLVNALILAKVEGLLHGGSLMESASVATLPVSPAPAAPGAVPPVAPAEGIPAANVELPSAPAPMTPGEAPVVGVPAPVETLPAAEPVVPATPAEPASAPAN